jgi:TonB family protein
MQQSVVWSFVVHLAAIAALVLIPRDWLTHRPPNTHTMTISLGGPAGPRTTGTANIGSRTVEQVAPPPRRPEPIRRPEPKSEPVAIPLRPQTPSERPADRTATTPAPPVTGTRVNQGNTAADTGAVGLGAGLRLSGGAGGASGEMDLKDFCCPEYLTDLAARISEAWEKNQPERGTTIIGFTIQRNGSATNIITEKSSGSGILDRASKNAITDARLPPLPPGYRFPTLTVHLQFPYGAP